MNELRLRRKKRLKQRQRELQKKLAEREKRQREIEKEAQRENKPIERTKKIERELCVKATQAAQGGALGVSREVSTSNYQSRAVH